MPDVLPPAIRHHISLVPQNARIRGMFFRWVDEFCLEQNIPSLSERKIDFKLYPTNEYLLYMATSLKPIADRIGFAEAFRLHAQFIFPNFKATLLGRSMTAAVLTPKAMMKIAPRSYKMLTEGARVDVTFLSASRIHVHYHDLWVFNDSFGVGTWEGVLKGLEVKGAVQVLQREGPANTLLQVDWVTKSQAVSRQLETTPVMPLHESTLIH